MGGGEMMGERGGGVCSWALLCAALMLWIGPRAAPGRGIALAWYLPGISPVDYEAGSPLEVFANKLTSPKNQVPYDYYTLPVCGSEEKYRSKKVNLGQLLVGERAKPTDYDLRMMIPETCKIMCNKTLDAKGVRRLKKRIRDLYSVRLNMDNMPLVVKGRTKAGSVAYHFGYPLGFVTDDETYISNHLKFRVLFHRSSIPSVSSSGSMTPAYRVVGFEVEPWSVAHSITDLNAPVKVSSSCPVKAGVVPQKVEEGATVWYSYDVEFSESPLAWATRWDPLMNANPELRQIQWFSIVNSFMIGIFLTALVGTILLRTVLRDFVRYNQLDDEEDSEDVTGWKLVHGDVFRAPAQPALLAILNGAGVQIFWITCVTLIFAVLGFLSPANRGGLLTALVTFFVLASVISGYSAARLYACLEGSEARRLVSMGSAFFFPGIVFGVFFVLNLLLWASGSSGAVPFPTLILLLFMWFGISVPLVFLGAYLGYKRKPMDFPVRTNQIPRQIPPPPFNIPKAAYAILSGVLPFGTVFMELVFILNSIWQNQVYYMFGFLFLVFVILVLTCAEMSIVFTYLALSHEDYKWWWHAFGTSASSGIYVLLYSLYYLISQPGFRGMSFVSVIIYLGYMALVSFGFALLCGAVGFYSSFLFVLRIFSAVRVD
ncbi:Transmembrane 9 superfamily member 7 [Porphyridium purpureum]|uniref:Transmembrane 9 superfamily member n=1 Tax=Porphyridium purpureum TaxID=35688 RepID=A0A5J4Z1K3_PORPP|nr:Transmembrane 9 superfamily member 7 [Porphyridium purpureum]|eukprot:POR5524..scf208_2